MRMNLWKFFFMSSSSSFKGGGFSYFTVRGTAMGGGETLPLVLEAAVVVEVAAVES